MSPAPTSPSPTVEQTAPTPSGSEWKRIITQNFAKDAALGQFTTAYPGWGGYDGNRDSSRNSRPLATVGLWNSKTTTSVHDGALDCDLHTQGTTPQVCSVTPTLTGRWWEGGMYARYSMRFRAESSSDYKLAGILWPSSNNWNEGELDWPEGYLNSTMTGAMHDHAKPMDSPVFVDTKTSMQDWHTVTTEWTPGRVTYLLDGKQVATSTASNVVPTTPTRWVLQAESSLTATPPNPSESVHIYVDWVTVDDWQG